MLSVIRFRPANGCEIREFTLFNPVDGGGWIT